MTCVNQMYGKSNSMYRCMWNDVLIWKLLWNKYSFIHSLKKIIVGWVCLTFVTLNIVGKRKFLEHSPENRCPLLLCSIYDSFCRGQFSTHPAPNSLRLGSWGALIFLTAEVFAGLLIWNKHVKFHYEIMLNLLKKILHEAVSTVNHKPGSHEFQFRLENKDFVLF